MLKRFVVAGLGAAALAMSGGAGVAQADETEGSVTLPGPTGCKVTVYWDTAGNPIVWASVPNPIYCIRPVIGTISLEEPGPE